MLSPYKKGKFRLTGIYGTRRDPFTGAAVAHHGVDLVGIDSKEICAVTDGKVVRSRIVTDPADRTSQWGEYIAVMAPDGGIVYYCHLSRRLAGVGDTVKRGDVIGVEGATGRATGSHLHLELRHGAEYRDITALLGIPNEVGVYGGEKTPGEYAALVARKCGLEAATVAYLNAYRYAADLWRKLWLAMEG